MKAEQLRKAILQMAIQGKLVPQDPNDEPASVLLEKIRAEKQRLIKERKIKKDKVDSIIFKGEDNRHYEKVGDEVKDITNEIDFDLPDGWEFTRINALVYIQTGASFKKEQASNDKTKIRVLRGGNILNGLYTFFDNDLFIDRSLISDSILLQENDLLTPAVTSIENIGKLALINRNYDNVTAGGFVFIIRPFFSNLSFAKYLLYSLQSAYFNRQMKSITKKSGQAFYNLGKERLIKLILPIPPFAEQKRIVAEIEKYEPLLVEYDKLEQQKSKLDGEIYDKLKKSILQYAIQGKLVPQDEKDKPASELLKRIRAEKKAQLGKKYVDSYIYKGDDNCYYEHIDGKAKDEAIDVPFELPNNWVWSRAYKYLDVRDGTHDTPKYVMNGFPLVTSKNLHNGAIDFDTAKLISKVDLDNINSRSEVDDDDILFAMIGSIGNPVKVKKDRAFAIKNMALFKPYLSTTNMEYVLYFLIFAQDIMKAQSFGAVQQFVSLNYLRDFLIPIPPLGEQKRIVDKINEMFAKL